MKKYSVMVTDQMAISNKNIHDMSTILGLLHTAVKALR